MKKTKPTTRKKITSKTTNSKKKLQAKTTSKKTTTRKKPGPKPTKKQVAGYSILKRETNTLAKIFGQLDKLHNSFADALNDYCYDTPDENRLKAYSAVTAAANALSKKVVEIKKNLIKSKKSLKPIYK